MNFTMVGTSYNWKQKKKVSHFVTGLFQLAHFQGPPMLENIAECNSFLRPNNILPCVYATFCWFIHMLVDV